MGHPQLGPKSPSTQCKSLNPRDKTSKTNNAENYRDEDENADDETLTEVLNDVDTQYDEAREETRSLITTMATGHDG